jgi:hypothetical protein
MESDEDRYFRLWVQPIIREFEKAINEGGVLPEGVTVSYDESGLLEVKPNE